MKLFRSLFIVAALAVAFTVTVQAQTTNVAPPVAQLTPADVASINNLLPLIPAAYQPAVIKFLAIIGTLGVIGRVLLGFRNGGIWGVITGLLGGTNTPKPADPNSTSQGAGAAALRKSSPLVLAFIILPASLLLFTGCKSYQAIEAMTGSGVNLSAAVPIPYSGGQSILGVKLIAGSWKSGTILQPTGTNDILSPAVAIRSSTGGNANVNGQAQLVGTNAVAGIGANGSDQLDVLTGQASDVFTNGLTAGK